MKARGQVTVHIYEYAAVLRVKGGRGEAYPVVQLLDGLVVEAVVDELGEAVGL